MLQAAAVDGLSNLTKSEAVDGVVLFFFFAAADFVLVLFLFFATADFVLLVLFLWFLEDVVLGNTGKTILGCHRVRDRHKTSFNRGWLCLFHPLWGSPTFIAQCAMR